MLSSMIRATCRFIPQYDYPDYPDRLVCIDSAFNFRYLGQLAAFGGIGHFAFYGDCLFPINYLAGRV